MRPTSIPRLPTISLLALFIALVSCEKETQSKRAESAPDSAGWRAATIADGRVSLRYPIAMTKTLVDRTTPACSTSNLLAITEDSTIHDGLIAVNTPATLDSIAASIGFTHSGDSWWLDEGSMTSRWTSGMQVQPVLTEGWTWMYGEVTMKFIGDDQQIAPGEDHLVPDQLNQSRVVAVRPLEDHCSLALFWHGGVYRGSTDSTRANDRRAAFEHLLRTVRITP